jgi:hypothetical protein
MSFATHDLSFDLPGAAKVVGEIVAPFDRSLRFGRNRSQRQKECKNQCWGFHRDFVLRFPESDLETCRESRTTTNPQQSGCSKTNAARASHPSRIVIADVLTAVFRRGRKIIVQIALRKAPCRDAHLRLALQGYDSALSSSVEGGFIWRPRSPGTGILDMRRISPGDSLSKATGNAEPLSEQVQNISRF